MFVCHLMKTGNREIRPTAIYNMGGDIISIETEDKDL